MTTIGVDIRVLGTGRTTGVEEYTDRLLAHLISIAPNVHFKLFSAGRRPIARRPWMDASNVSLFETGFSNRWLWFQTRCAGRPYLDQLVGGADVFFFPHFLLGATTSECRRVLTIHDLSFERFPELFSFGRRLWHRFQMQPRRQVQEADRIIAVSESTRRDLMSLYGVEPGMITTIHSGIDPMPPHRPEGNYLLMLGTIEPRKNIEAVVAAFERLPAVLGDTQLIIAGPVGWLWRRIVDRIRRSPRRSAIHLVHDITDQERRRLLSGARALIYPSLLEGFGFPPLEAMACGTPVIAAANSSILQVSGGGALLINPYSVDEIEQALWNVLNDAKLRDMLTQRGLRTISQYSWRSTAEQTLAVMLQ